MKKRAGGSGILMISLLLIACMAEQIRNISQLFTLLIGIKENGVTQAGLHHLFIFFAAVYS